jgi:hypothetical protein
MAWAAGPVRAAQEAGEVEAMPIISGAAEDYARTCQGCHLGDGSGMPGLVPRMRGFVGYFAHLPDGREFLVRVPGVALAPLDDARLTAVINWTLFSFSPGQLPPDFRPFTVDEVSRLRQRPLDQIQGLRAALIAELQARGLIPQGEDGFGPGVLR